MNDKQQFPRSSTGKKRLEELRKKRKHPGAAESIHNQRSMILINIVIESATGIILLTGLLYIFRYVMMKRFSFDPKYFKLILSCLVIFSFGWFTYLTMKIRTDIIRFRKAGNNNTQSNKNTQSKF